MNKSLILVYLGFICLIVLQNQALTSNLGHRSLNAKRLNQDVTAPPPSTDNATAPNITVVPPPQNVTNETAPSDNATNQTAPSDNTSNQTAPENITNVTNVTNVTNETAPSDNATNATTPENATAPAQNVSAPIGGQQGIENVSIGGLSGVIPKNLSFNVNGQPLMKSSAIKIGTLFLELFALSLIIMIII